MKRYTMTQEELESLYAAARTPGVFTGGVLAGHDPARSASEKVWQKIGERLGFQWRTVEPVAGAGNETFEAEPQAS